MGILTPAGFVAAGGSVGIKASGAFDAAIVASADGRAVPTAGVFTQNLAAAAPVQLSRQHLEANGGLARAMVLTSGNANAATGRDGLAAALSLCVAAASAIGCEPHEVLLAQTGLIGIPFPTATAAAGVATLAATCHEGGGDDAAQAILTTDTVKKEVTIAGEGFSVGGMAKGAAMLAPNMATMLAVLTTDAQCDPVTLKALLRAAVGSSFNELSVDGCTSTNDTVVVLASGRGAKVSDDVLGQALSEGCASLAGQMAADAEGHTKVARIIVSGAASDEEAHRGARKIGTSMLVKCSLNGEDPYWGRVVSELGSAGIDFDIDKVSVFYGGIEVCRGGITIDHDHAALATHMQSPFIELRADLGLGTGTGALLATDLSYGYIDENRTTS